MKRLALGSLLVLALTVTLTMTGCRGGWRWWERGATCNTCRPACPTCEPVCGEAVGAGLPYDAALLPSANEPLPAAPVPSGN